VPVASLALDVLAVEHADDELGRPEAVEPVA
jgi:hypothetical protein